MTGGVFTNTAERILLLMKQCGFDQKTFAKQLEIRPQAITEWKNGTTHSYTKRITQIAALLNTTTNYLLTGDEKKEPALVSESEPSDPLEAQLMNLVRQLSPDGKKMLIAQLESVLRQK